MIGLNESPADRVIRVVLGLALIAVAYLVVSGGFLGWLLGVVGLILIATGAMGFCPIYAGLGLSSLGKKNE